MEVEMKNVLTTAVMMFALSAPVFAQQSVIVTDPQPTGSTVVVPGEVRTYVTQQSIPSVVYDGDIAVGATLPGAVVVHTVPDSDGYAYTIVNERRVIVDPQTHRIVDVLN
jgi:hypothetical protein